MAERGELRHPGAALIVIESESWLSFLFAVRGTTWSRIWRRLFVNMSFAAAVTIAHYFLGMTAYDVTALPFTLIGFVLSIFLGFRINTAYDRFWEGRKLWGSLVNTSRSLTRQILTLVVPHGEAQAGPEELRARRKQMVYALIAFVHALRLRLRGEEATTDELVGLLAPEALAKIAAARNRPNAIVQHLAELFEEARRAGLIHPLQLVLLHQGLVGLSDVQGACERIANTPIPFAYQVLLRRIVGVYCYALPFGLLHALGPVTPVVVLMMSYAFYGLDAIGDEIHAPFGNDPNDLPLSALCRTIEIDLREALGETELPEPAQPHHGLLL